MVPCFFVFMEPNDIDSHTNWIALPSVIDDVIQDIPEKPRRRSAEEVWEENDLRSRRTVFEQARRKLFVTLLVMRLTKPHHIKRS